MFLQSLPTFYLYHVDWLTTCLGPPNSRHMLQFRSSIDYIHCPVALRDGRRANRNPSRFSVLSVLPQSTGLVTKQEHSIDVLIYISLRSDQRPGASYRMWIIDSIAAEGNPLICHGCISKEQKQIMTQPSIAALLLLRSAVGWLLFARTYLRNRLETPPKDRRTPPGTGRTWFPRRPTCTHTDHSAYGKPHLPTHSHDTRTPDNQGPGSRNHSENEHEAKSGTINQRLHSPTGRVILTSHSSHLRPP